MKTVFTKFFLKGIWLFKKKFVKPLRMLFFFASCKQTAATYLHYLGWSHVCVNDSLSLSHSFLEKT